GCELELHRADRDEAAGADIRLADLGAIEEGPVGRVEVAEQVTLGVADDLAVDAADRLLCDDDVVLLGLADADDGAAAGAARADHELAAALDPAHDHQLALRQVDRRPFVATLDRHAGLG